MCKYKKTEIGEYSKNSVIGEYIEKYVKKNGGVHSLEDSIRYNLILGKISLVLLILFARIQYGRLMNALNDHNRKLDFEHIKAIMLSTACIVFSRYLLMNSSVDNLLINELDILINYYINIIKIFLDKNNDYSSLKKNDKKYYIFCNKWMNYCIYILEQTSHENFNDIKNNFNELNIKSKNNIDFGLLKIPYISIECFLIKCTFC